MKFFKHFTDAHRGQSLQQIKRLFGWGGLGRYWTLVELCAEKLEKGASEEFNDSHCHFIFEEVYLMRALGLPNLSLLAAYLDGVACLGLASVERVSGVVKCSMPKLLESLDRDSKRARTGRALAAPKIKIEDKELRLRKKILKENASPLIAAEIDALYKKYPRKVGKSLGQKRLQKDLKTPDDVAACSAALEKFVAYHRDKGTEPNFIPHFSTWTSSWRDWLDLDAGAGVLAIKPLLNEETHCFSCGNLHEACICSWAKGIKL